MASNVFCLIERKNQSLSKVYKALITSVSPWHHILFSLHSVNSTSWPAPLFEYVKDIPVSESLHLMFLWLRMLFQKISAWLT